MEAFVADRIEPLSWKGEKILKTSLDVNKAPFSHFRPRAAADLANVTCA